MVSIRWARKAGDGTAKSHFDNAYLEKAWHRTPPALYLHSTRGEDGKL